MRGKGRPSRHTQIAACAHSRFWQHFSDVRSGSDHVRSRGRADLPTSSSTSENDPNSDLRTAGLNSQQSRLLQRGFTANLLVFGWADKPGVNMARLGPVAQAAGALTIILVCTAGANAQITDKPPFWAYTYNPPDFKPPPDDGQPRHVPESTPAGASAQRHDEMRDAHAYLRAAASLYRAACLPIRGRPAGGYAARCRSTYCRMPPFLK